MSTVLLGAASKPSFRKEFLRIRKLVRIFASNHDTVAENKRILDWESIRSSPRDGSSTYN